MIKAQVFGLSISMSVHFNVSVNLPKPKMPKAMTQFWSLKLNEMHGFKMSLCVDISCDDSEKDIDKINERHVQKQCNDS